MTLQELIKFRQEKVNQILENNNVFWAFSEKQLHAGMEEHGIKATGELVKIGSGGLMPKTSLTRFSNDMLELNREYAELEKNLDDKIRLKRVSAEHYENMLCVLPPAYYNGSTFQVGEPHSHVMLNGKEYPTYASYTKRGDRCYCMGNLTTPQVKAYIGA